MRTMLLALLVLTSIALPRSARACDPGCTERHAWGSFFAQSGFAIAATAGVPVLHGAGWDASREETAIVILAPALTGLGATLGYVAEEGGWDPGLGWALAGTWPGALLGASLGISSAMIAAPDDRDALHAGIATGTAVGALAGALAWYAEHADHGRPGAMLGGFYAGYFAGLLAGLGAYAMGDGVEAQVAPLLASATGAVVGVLVAELLRTAR